MRRHGGKQKMMKVPYVLSALLLFTSIALAQTPLSVPIDRKAQYFAVEKGGTGAARLIVTKRVGPEGTGYTKRLYNCANNTVKFLGSAGSLEEMGATKPDSTMVPIVAGSIEYFIGLEACK